MKTRKHLKLATTTEIADVLGTSRQNINESYINKPNKVKMTTALIYGSYMLMEDVTPEEMILARELILAKRRVEE